MLYLLLLLGVFYVYRKHHIIQNIYDSLDSFLFSGAVFDFFSTGKYKNSYIVSTGVKTTAQIIALREVKKRRTTDRGYTTDIIYFPTFKFKNTEGEEIILEHVRGNNVNSVLLDKNVTIFYIKESETYHIVMRNNLEYYVTAIVEYLNIF